MLKEGCESLLDLNTLEKFLESDVAAKDFYPILGYFAEYQVAPTI